MKPKRAILRGTKRGRETLSTDYLHDILTVMERIEAIHEETREEVKEIKDKLGNV